MRIKKSAWDKTVANLRKQMAQPGPRQSHGSPDVKIDKENFCFTKYLRGICKGDWTDAEEEQRIYKALSSRYSTDGGVFVPTEASTDIIGFLKAKAVIRSLPGVKVVVLGSPKLEFPRQQAAAAVTWGTDENTAITEDTALYFGKSTLELKDAKAYYKMSRKLIKYANVSIDAMVKQELGEAMALAEDLKFLEGQGGDEPLGIYYHPGVNNTDLSATPTFDDFSGADYQVEKDNGGPLTAWVTHPRIAESLRELKDGHGRYLWSDGQTIAGGGSMVVPTIGGKPVSYSTQIPITNRPSSDETYTVGGNWANFLIGDGENIRVESTTEGGGSFLADQMYIKAVKEVDCLLKQPKSFVLVKGIQ